MNNWQRLEQVIKWTGLSTNAFALGIGLKRSENLYQIKRGSFGISKELARLITVKYPMINRSWLLTGDGDMMCSSSLNGNSEEIISRMEGAIPYYQSDIVSLTRGIAPKASGYIILPLFSGAAFAAIVMGNAMYPLIPGGSIAVVRSSSVNSVLPGETYLVTTKDYVALRKVRTIEGGDDHKLLLVADNREQYDDIIVDKTNISSIYLLMGVIVNHQI